MFQEAKKAFKDVFDGIQCLENESQLQNVFRAFPFKLNPMTIVLLDMLK